MHSFTPRTCLWPLTVALLFTFALSIGLTFRSNHACYAGVCGEWLFPLQARLHVVVWYCWLSLSVVVLALRAFHPSMGKFLRFPLLPKKIPLIQKGFHVSGAVVVLWIAVLYAAVTGIWWQRLESYFDDRGRADGITKGNRILAAIALTGHYGDITMGMALIPVSRHSALASFFKLSVSTTLTFHMLTAYTLFTIVLVHGILYVAWLPTLTTLNLQVLQPYPILEPTYSAHEVYPGDKSSLGIWRASLIFTGTASALIMVLLAVTTLPKIRTRHFNLFYFTHLTSILAVIIVCLHASTMFYCTAPGLAMIMLDWGMRLYDLKRKHNAHVVHLGRGWYSLSVDLPRHRLKGCACNSPLAHFYIQHGPTSWRELHPFTTITHLATQDNVASPQDTTLSIRFLFRKARAPYRDARKSSVDTVEDEKAMHPVRRLLAWTTCGFGRKKDNQVKLQWTEKLAMIADADMQSEPTRNGGEESSHELVYVPTSVRFEGPYFTPATPHQYHTVLCFVAGTGISGALAIAAAFSARWDDMSRKQHESNHTSRAQSVVEPGVEEGNDDTDDAATLDAQSHALPGWNRLIICWSVRAEDHIELPYISTKTPGLEIRPFLTGGGRPRMDMTSIIRSLKDESSGSLSCPAESTLLQSPSPSPSSSSSSSSSGQSPTKQNVTPHKIWTYISGPNLFITAAETACKSEKVDFYGARWDI